MSWLDELVEISKKDLNELTGEDMARLITPLISFSKFSSDEFPLNRNKYHDPKQTVLGYLEGFSGKYKESIESLSASLDQLKKNNPQAVGGILSVALSNLEDSLGKYSTQIYKLYAYLEQLNNKLQQILDSDIISQKYYSLIPLAGHVESESLSIFSSMGSFYSKSFFEKVISMDMDKFAVDLAHSLLDVIFKMNLCALKIERQSGINKTLGSHNRHVFVLNHNMTTYVFEVPYITYGMAVDPSEFVYYSDFFAYGNRVMELVKGISKKINLSINSDNLIDALSGDLLSGLDTLKIFYLSQKGKCLVNVLDKDFVSLHMDEKTYNLAEKIWPLTEREIFLGCAAQMQKTRKNTSLKDEFPITMVMKNFDIYVGKNKILLHDKHNDIMLGRETETRNRIASAIDLLDAAFKHALQKKEEKERLIEDLPDMDR